MAHQHHSRPLARLGATDRDKVYCPYKLYNGQFCAGPLGTKELVRVRIGTEVTGWGHYLYFGQGWIKDRDAIDGLDVYRESENAHRRRQRGRPAKYRTTLGREIAVVGLPKRAFGPAAYPSIAVCPFCEREALLEQEALGVDGPTPDPAFVAGKEVPYRIERINAASHGKAVLQ